MKLPLYIHYKYPNWDTHSVIDANHKVICTFNGHGLKAARAMVRKFNRTLSFMLFNKQPYEYTRQDLLEDNGRNQ